MRLFSNMLTFNRVRDGEDGKQGPMPVNAGQWNKDVEYIKDEFVQPYVWQIKNGKKLYYLLVAEKSKGDDPYTNNTQGNGDIWRYREEYDLFLARKIQADDIDVDNLVVRKLKSKESGPRVEIEGSLIKIFGESLLPNIISGVDENGYAVLTYYANNGEKLYDLGPNGLNKIDFAPRKWTTFNWVKMAGDVDASTLINADFNYIKHNTYLQSQAPKFYTYYAGGSPLITPEERKREEYTYVDYDYNLIPDGWYFEPPRAHLKDFPLLLSKNTGKRIKPGNEMALYEYHDGVTDRDNIYYTSMYRYRGGKRTETRRYYWQEAPI